MSKRTECLDTKGNCVKVSILKELCDGSDADDYFVLKDTAMKKTGCQTESCLLQKYKEKRKLDWDNKGDLYKEIVQQTSLLIPFGPKDSLEWLSDEDIMNVCNMYQFLYDNYTNCGIRLIDLFDPNSNKEDSAQDMANQIISGRDNSKFFSVIFNTDVRTGKGEHWFAVLFSIENNIVDVEIFDSQRAKVETNIIKFLDNVIAIIAQQKNLKKGEVKLTSHGKHQKKNSECGVYSLNYIKQRITGKNPEQFLKETIPDEKMYDFRKDIFREYKITGR